MYFGFRDIAVDYGKKEVLRGLTLEIPRGKVVTLIGQNGCGKSTLLKTVSKAVTPKRGKVIYLDWQNPEGAERLTINLETVFAADPDIIIVQCHAGTDAAKAQVEETYGSNPVWQSLSAVRNGKVFYLEKTLFHNKPNSRFAEAYQKLAEILYPDAAFSFKKAN